uniref:Uncharacterized protein n=2 Tax=Paenibacillus athensensis TaxID=1967502 RepID=A0A4Y8Q1P5_9BACL
MDEALFSALSERVTADIYADFPELLERYGERGRQKCIDDNMHPFRHLETADALRCVKVFTDYAVWPDGILRKHGMTTALLIDNFERIARMADSAFEPDKAARYRSYLASGSDILRSGADSQLP